MGDPSDEIQASCAICGGPGEPECYCERDRLKTAIDQAEQRWKANVLAEVRNTITNLSVQAVTHHFHMLSQHRRDKMKRRLMQLPYYTHYVQRLPLHPSIVQTIRSQIEIIYDELQHGLDEDWKSSVIRYPEVLDYYYNRMIIRMPSPETPPPPGLLSAPSAPGSPNSSKKGRAGGRSMANGMGRTTTPRVEAGPTRPPPPQTRGRRGSVAPPMMPQAPSVPSPTMDWQSYAQAAGWMPPGRGRAGRDRHY